MILVARYANRELKIYRKVRKPAEWRIKIWGEREDGSREETNINVVEKMRLSDIHETALEENRKMEGKGFVDGGFDLWAQI